MSKFPADFTLELTPRQIAECRDFFKSAEEIGGIIHTSIGTVEGSPKFYFKILSPELAAEMERVIHEFFEEENNAISKS